MSNLVWQIPQLLLLVLLYALFRRGAYRSFPCFFAYVAYAVAAGFARIITESHPRPYFVTYWLSDAGYALLGTVAMYEILRMVLRGISGIWWTRRIFPNIVAAGVGLGIWRMYEVPPQVHGQLLVWVVTGEIAVRFVQVLVFIGLAALVAFFGLLWRQYAVGIAAGFGFYAMVALLITLKLSATESRFRVLWNAISVVAYSLSVLVWIWSFSAPREGEPLLRNEFRTAGRPGIRPHQRSDFDSSTA